MNATTIMTGNMRQRHARQRRNGTHVEAVDINGARRVVIYARISKSRDNETSTESQVAECKAYCARMGWTVVATFVDIGESAFGNKAPRPEFAKALATVRTHNANTLMVWKLDRFMRDASTATTTKDQIHSWGGSLVSATENVDTADRLNPATTLVFNVLAWIAEMESATKSDRTKAWHSTRFGDGNGHKALPPTGAAPFGYMRDPEHPNTLTVIPEQAMVIREAARAILSGAPLSGTVDAINTSGAAGRTFTRKGFKHVLTSETTAGLRFDGTEHHVGNWEPILDRTTWHALCELFSDPTRKTTGNNGARVHMLGGMLTCGKCGSMMRADSHSSGNRYACTGAKCYSAIMLAATDEAVDAYVLDVVDEDAWNIMRERGRGFDPEVITDIKARLAKVTGLYASGAIDEAAYDEGRHVLEARLEAAHASEYVELPAIDDFRSAWPTLDVDAKRLILNAFVERITILPYETGMSIRERVMVDAKA